MDYMKLKSLLEGFVSEGCIQYNDELDGVLRDTAQSGTVRMPWELFKPLLQYKIEKILSMDTFASLPSSVGGATASGDDKRKQLLKLLDNFQHPPFTIQRVCELVINPCQHYKRKVCFMRALEKNLTVISTVEPDLISKRTPMLAHSLEVKPPTPSDKILSPPVCDVLDKQPAINKKLDEIVLPHSHSASFTLGFDHTCPATLPPVMVGVKRSASIRDVQLQEPDCTVAFEGSGSIPAVGGVLSSLGAPPTSDLTKQVYESTMDASILTAGAIKAFLDGNGPSCPKLQILRIKKVMPKVSTKSEQYILHISDSLTFRPAILTKSLHKLVHSEELDENCVVQVGKMASKSVSGFKCIILANLTVVHRGIVVGKKLGDPKPLKLGIANKTNQQK